MVRNRPKSGAKRSWQEQETANARQREDVQRKHCTALKFWLVCGKAVCRRKRGCGGDPSVCFSTHWALLPEDFKAYWRGCIKTAQTTSSVEDIDRGGNAAREIYLKSVGRSSAVSAAAQPERTLEGDTDARIRRL